MFTFKLLELFRWVTCDALLDLPHDLLFAFVFGHGASLFLFQFFQVHFPFAVADRTWGGMPDSPIAITTSLVAVASAKLAFDVFAQRSPSPASSASAGGFFFLPSITSCVRSSHGDARRKRPQSQPSAWHSSAPSGWPGSRTCHSGG